MQNSSIQDQAPTVPQLPKVARLRLHDSVVEHLRNFIIEGVLAPGWTVDTATDMLLALVSNGVGETLLADRGWTPEQMGDRMARLLHSTFVATGTRGGRPLP